MAAIPTITASSASTADIAKAAEAWKSAATFSAEAYAALSRRVGRDLPGALVQAGLDLNAAVDMAEGMRVDLSNLSQAFLDVAQLADALIRSREDILEMVAKAKSSNGSDGAFRVGR